MTGTETRSRTRFRRGPTTSLAVWSLPGVAYSLTFLMTSSSIVEGRRVFTLFDDAAISKTYGRTLAATGELVWFPGAERVEGVSNLAWTGVMAVVHLLGFRGSGAALAISLIGIGLLLAHAIATGRLVRILVPSHPTLANVATLTTAAIYPLTFWTVRGFETGAIALLSVQIVISAVRLSRIGSENTTPSRSQAFWPFALSAGLLLTIRLDGLIVPVVALGWLFLQNANARSRAIELLILVGGLLTVISLWRLSYFGSPVPNTYFLKVSDAPVGLRLSRGLAYSASITPIVALTTWSLAHTIFRRPRWPLRLSEHTLPGLAFLALAAYSIWIGGDAWEWSGFANRFLSTGLGLAFATCIAVIGPPLLSRGAGQRANRPFRAFVGIALTAVTLLTLGSTLIRGVIEMTSLEILVQNWLGRGLDASTDDWTAWATRTFEPLLVIVLFVALSAAARLRDQQRLVLVASALALLAMSTTPLSPVRAFASLTNAMHVEDDARMARLGSELQRATHPNAVIATVWAGNAAYYAEREMIDLLGKSDQVIARLKPEITDWRELYPGHNKWDYEHSIGALRPDVIFQLWRTEPEDLEFIAAYGYSDACLGTHRVRILDESQRIIFAAFSAPGPQGCGR